MLLMVEVGNISISSIITEVMFFMTLVTQLANNFNMVTNCNALSFELLILYPNFLSSLIDHVHFAH